MTSEEVLLIIEKAKDRDYTVCVERGRWKKKDLAVLLGFMYYSHLKMVDVLKLRPNDISRRGGIFYSDRYKSEMYFTIPDKLFLDVNMYIQSNGINNNDLIIQNKKRALIYAFKQVAKENNIVGCKITDVLYAGLRDNPEICKPEKR